MKHRSVFECWPGIFGVLCVAPIPAAIITAVAMHASGPDHTRSVAGSTPADNPSSTTLTASVVPAPDKKVVAAPIDGDGFTLSLPMANGHSVVPRDELTDAQIIRACRENPEAAGVLCDAPIVGWLHERGIDPLNPCLSDKVPDGADKDWRRRCNDAGLTDATRCSEMLLQHWGQADESFDPSFAPKGGAGCSSADAQTE